MLSDVTICITTFLRPGYMFKCCEGVTANLPECKLQIVADDCGWGVAHIVLPFDSGLSAKRNAGVRACQTKYWLCGCDDFDFSTKEARMGIEKLTRILDDNPDIDVAGGRVDGREYEGFLEYIPGDCIREHSLSVHPPDLQGKSVEVVITREEYFVVDLTVNYFLARTDVLKQFPWPEEMRIGGEHVCLFLDLKHAGKKVVWVPGVNVNTLQLGNGPDVQDSRYNSFRRRAINLGHPLMKKRYNITRYIGFDGGVS